MAASRAALGATLLLNGIVLLTVLAELPREPTSFLFYGAAGTRPGRDRAAYAEAASVEVAVLLGGSERGLGLVDESGAPGTRPMPGAAVPPVRRPGAQVNPKAVLTVVALAQVMVILDATVVNVALPTIKRELGTSEQSLSWILNAYTFQGNLRDPEIAAPPSVTFGRALCVIALPSCPPIRAVETPSLAMFRGIPFQAELQPVTFL